MWGTGARPARRLWPEPGAGGAGAGGEGRAEGVCCCLGGVRGGLGAAPAGGCCRSGGDSRGGRAVDCWSGAHGRCRGGGRKSPPGSLGRSQGRRRGQDAHPSPGPPPFSAVSRSDFPPSLFRRPFRCLPQGCRGDSPRRGCSRVFVPGVARVRAAHASGPRSSRDDGKPREACPRGPLHLGVPPKMFSSWVLLANVLEPFENVLLSPQNRVFFQLLCFVPTIHSSLLFFRDSFPHC